MQIDVKGRNCNVSDELREHVEKRFAKVGKQVSELARLVEQLRSKPTPDTLRAFSTLLRRHIRSEENDLFQRAQETIPAPEATEELSAARSVASI